jgi:hypothetical protein
MEPWTFARAVSFFLAHARQPIVVRQRGSTLRVAGQLAAFDERDACSMDLVEAGVDLGLPGVHCTLTLHETTLLIHLTGEAGERRVFLPVSIPYTDLVLEGAAAAQAEPAPEPRSPYELL